MSDSFGMSRDQAVALLEEHLAGTNLRKHSIATEAIMRALARRFGEDEEHWGLTGLLHDLDYEATAGDPATHGLKTEAWLRDRGVSEEALAAIKAHNAEGLGGERSGRFQHALAAAETITGLIVATALVYPDKKIASVKVKSVLKRMKKKDFARGVCRETIRECEKIGLPLNDFVELSLGAMSTIADDLGL